MEPDWEDDDADKAEDRLINQESKHKATPIMRAALKGHLDVVNLLLERGADVSVEDHHKDTALTIAIAKRHVDVGVSLISAGADKDHKNKFGWTPLMLALLSDAPSARRLACVHQLLGCGASVVPVASGGWNAALCAARRPAKRAARAKRRSV